MKKKKTLILSMLLLGLLIISFSIFLSLNDQMLMKNWLQLIILEIILQLLIKQLRL